MKRTLLALTVFMVVAFALAIAQQPSATPGQMGGQSTSPSSQMPSAGQQPTMPGTAGQSTAPGTQPAVPGQEAGTVTEGCLGGTNPNFTITDTSGKTYKLNIPAGANASVLTSHVGESVQVAGDVKQAGSSNAIDVTRVGRGTSNCPGHSAQPTTNNTQPPKQ